MGHGETINYFNGRIGSFCSFDTVDHDILLAILNNKFGIEGKALQWFNQYLRHHSFKVAVNGNYSKEHDLLVSVPQGSCAGANIFNLYCSPLHEVVHKDLSLSGFADDHSVRKCFKAANREEEHRTKQIIEECMLNVKRWMDETHLKMNPVKTEFIYFGFPKQLSKCTSETINVVGNLITRTSTIRYLGMWMDSSFKTHVTKKCQATMINFICIRNIWHLLTAAATESLLLSLYISHIDFCNALLYGLPDVTIKKFQSTEHLCMLSLKKS